MKEAQATVQHFAWLAMREIGAEPLQGAVELHLTVFRAKGRPTSKIGREAAESDAVRPITTPDCSNLAKGVEDALSGICFRDDAQVVALHVEKRFSASPRVEVEVREWVPRTSTLGKLCRQGGMMAKWVKRQWPETELLPEDPLDPCTGEPLTGTSVLDKFKDWPAPHRVTYEGETYQLVPQESDLPWTLLYRAVEPE
jgi:Holliday junction resolvase RusA-like endonuclease